MQKVEHLADWQLRKIRTFELPNILDVKLVWDVHHVSYLLTHTVITRWRQSSGCTCRGLAMDAMLSLLGFPGIPFFVLIWIMGRSSQMNRWRQALTHIFLSQRRGVFPPYRGSSRHIPLRLCHALLLYNEGISDDCIQHEKSRYPNSFNLPSRLFTHSLISSVPTVGMWFGILIGWMTLSCITVALFGYVRRRRDMRAKWRRAEMRARDK